eukprot:Hpha_TRINITY_DN18399_c0_g1::TRINITY_DN18399_c0_g1_i1::g.158301::m.158301
MLPRRPPSLPPFVSLAAGACPAAALLAATRPGRPRNSAASPCSVPGLGGGAAAHSGGGGQLSSNAFSANIIRICALRASSSARDCRSSKVARKSAFAPPPHRSELRSCRRDMLEPHMRNLARHLEREAEQVARCAAATEASKAHRGGEQISTAALSDPTSPPLKLASWGRRRQAPPQRSGSPHSAHRTWGTVSQRAPLPLRAAVTSGAAPHPRWSLSQVSARSVCVPASAVPSQAIAVSCCSASVLSSLRRRSSVVSTVGGTGCCRAFCSVERASAHDTCSRCAAKGTRTDGSARRGARPFEEGGAVTPRI